MWSQGHLRGGHRVPEGLQDKAGPALGGEQGVSVALSVGLVRVLIERGSPGLEEQAGRSLHPPPPPVGHRQATEGEGQVDVVAGEGGGLLPVQRPDLLGHRHRGHHPLPWTQVALRPDKHYRGGTGSSHLKILLTLSGRTMQFQNSHLSGPRSEALEAPGSIAEEDHGAVPVDQRPQRRVAGQARCVPNRHVNQVATHSQLALHLVEAGSCVTLQKMTKSVDDKCMYTNNIQR